MKIALCQLNSIIGNLDFNKNKIINGYKKGVEAGADLVICPELSLVGYPPRDLVEKSEFRDAVKDKLLEIAKTTNDVGLIFGAITEDEDLIGTNIHNSAILCFKGKVQFIQNKSLIPNYDVFDEKEEAINKWNGIKLKDFRIVAWETVGGYFYVKARDEDHARELAQEKVDDYGDDCFIDNTHRETQIVEIEEE